jgi:hypothetical protein
MRQQLLTWLCHITKANVATRNNPKLGVGLGRHEGEHATLEFLLSRGQITPDQYDHYRVYGIPKAFYHDED